MNTLTELAQLLKAKNEIEGLIAGKINRPALTGHIGEYIASQIFDIKLCDSATNPAIDGVFMSGMLKGKSVNVKYYGKEEHLLDITTKILPDYYLVMTGSKANASGSKGKTRPFIIESVFLFEAKQLVETLANRNIKIGVATSVISSIWDDARIYPCSSGILQISDEQKELLQYFH